MKINYDALLNKVGIMLLGILTIMFFALATRIPEAMGESDDYMLTTEALQNHFSLRITADDVEKAKRDFPEHAWYFQSSWDAGMPALFSVKEGEVYPWYMGTYSLVCIPMKLCLTVLGLNQSYAFPLTNAAFAALALLVCWFKSRISTGRKVALIIMLGFSPIWWYIRWPSAEVFIFSLVVMSLVYFVNRNYHVAGLLVSIAGTLNIAIMAYGLFIIIDYTKETYCRFAMQGEKNIINIIKRNRRSIFLLVLCFVPSLITPIFNLANFGLINLQSILGFATFDGYFSRVCAHLFDLNIGFLPYFPIVFLMFWLFIIIKLMRKSWRAFVYFGAFLGTVMLYSVTYHINSGMSGLPRYSAWTFPIILFYVVAENEFLIKWINKLALGAMMLSTIFTISIVREHNTELEQTAIAQWVLDKAPSYYNPYYPIFISRVAGIGGGYVPYEEEVPTAIALGTNYEVYLPTVYCDTQGNVRKILTIPEFNGVLLNFFMGSESDMLDLANKIQDNAQSLYYINLSGQLKIRDEYYNSRFAYVYGDILKSGERVPLTKFFVTNGGQIGQNEILLPSGAFQYGPYMPLDTGSYVITIIGSNLDNVYEDAMINNQLASIELIERESTTIKYILKLAWDASSVELRCLNNGDDLAIINQIRIDSVNE